MNNSEPTLQPSRRTFLIGLAAAIGLVAFITILATIVLFFSGDKKQTVVSTDPKVVTQETVQKNLDASATRIEQAAKDQDAAKAALNDDTKRTKLGN